MYRSMMVSLKYGNERLELTVPASSRLLTAPKVKSEKILTAERVDAALQNPTGTAPFCSLFSPDDRVTIIVPDITRLCGAPIFLPPMIRQLNDVGIEDGAITILFANGTHRGHSDEERCQLVGESIVQRITCLDHNANGPEMVDAGFSVDGEPIKLNRHAVECDRLILTGSVSFHYLAGFGGGRKAIMPGVASFEAAKRLHHRSLDPDGQGRHPNATAGVLDGNPLHEFATETMRQLNPAFLLNTVMNAAGEVVDLAAGDPEEAFILAINTLRAKAEIKLDTGADVVVASCGGYPKDINMVQSHKSLDNAANALGPGGGRLFLAAECRDGGGSNSFLDWFRLGGPEKIEAALRRDFAINGQTAFAIAEKTARYDVTLLSTLDPRIVRSMGMRAADSRESFLAEATAALEEATHGYVILDAAYIIPEIGNDR